MNCPKCPERSEVVFAAMSESLVCLTPGCGWERLLDEEETFGLFFGRGPLHASPMEPESVATLVGQATP